MILSTKFTMTGPWSKRAFQSLLVMIILPFGLIIKYADKVGSYTLTEAEELSFKADISHMVVYRFPSN